MPTIHVFGPDNQHDLFRETACPGWIIADLKDWLKEKYQGTLAGPDQTLCPDLSMRTPQGNWLTLPNQARVVDNARKAHCKLHWNYTLSDKAELAVCTECGHYLSGKATSCPRCGLSVSSVSQGYGPDVEGRMDFHPAGGTNTNAHPLPKAKGTLKENVHWHFIHPNVQKKWRCRLGSRVTLKVSSGGKVDDLPPDRLLQSGIVSGLFYEKGIPGLLTTFDALFVAQEFELIQKILHSFNETKMSAELCALQYFMEGDRTGRSQDMKNILWNNRLEELSIVLLYFAYADQEETKRLITEAEHMGTKSLIYCAKLWKCFFGDELRSEYCLQEAEAEEDPIALIECAETWMALFGEKAKARRLLEQAEKYAEFSFDLLLCAEAWNHLFDDVELSTGQKIFW